ncbi:c-type cytochrome [Sulfurimonas sp.]
MRFIIIFVLLIVELFANSAAYNRGETLFFAKGCSSCHGPAAEGSSSYPRLAQKPKKYLIKRLKAFRAGKAITVSQQMMAQFANNLNDRNIDDLATFLSQHKKTKIEDVADDYLGGVGS